jgi:hypothetical protein
MVDYLIKRLLLTAIVSMAVLIVSGALVWLIAVLVDSHGTLARASCAINLTSDS